MPSGFFADCIGIYKSFGVVLRNVTRPKVTEPLVWKGPRTMPAHPARYRQTLGLTRDENGEVACIACSACAKICPSGIITVTATPRSESPKTGKKRQYPEQFVIDLNACIFCEMCVQVCPSDAIRMLSVHQPAGYQREDLVLTLDKLLDAHKLGPWSEATSSLLKDMQDPTRKPASIEGVKE